MIDARIDPLFTMSDNTSPRGPKSNTETKMFLRTSEDPAGGARRDRTDDLLLAKQALSQLSYGPGAGTHACPARPEAPDARELGGPGKT
jgi:hypothetical protein